MDKFEVDAERARGWLEAACAEGSIPADWRASGDPEMVESMIGDACRDGVIKVPEPGCAVAFEQLPGESFRYLLQFRAPSPWLSVADGVTDMALLDSRPGAGEPVTGLASALAVLEQAAEAGNDLLGALHRFVDASAGLAWPG